MKLTDGEPPCLVEGLSHAWVPKPDRDPDYHRSQCGRCHLTRVVHPSGFVSYWESPKARAEAGE